MHDDHLINILIEHQFLDAKQAKEIFKLLMSDSSLAVEEVLVSHGYISYSKLIQIINEFIHIPIAQTMLDTRDEIRAKSPPPKIWHSEQAVDPHVLNNGETKLKNYFSVDGIDIKGPPLDIKQWPDLSNDEYQVLSMAIEFVSKGNFEDAELYLYDSVMDNPESRPLVYELAWLYINTDNSEKALELIKGLHPKLPNDKAIIELTAFALQKSSRHLEAISYYQNLLSLKNPKSIWHFHLALSLEEKNLVDQAQKVYQHFIDVTSNEEKLQEFANQHIINLGNQRGQQEDTSW